MKLESPPTVDITAEFVLAEGTEIISVSELPSVVVQKIVHAEGDYLIRRKGVRSGPKIITPELCRLLKLFNTPKTITEVVALESLYEGRDPMLILSEVYPAIESLIRADILVNEGSVLTQKIIPTLLAGELFEGMRVIRCLTYMNDMEIYVVESETFGRAILKIVRQEAPDQTYDELTHEGLILNILNGMVSPKLHLDGWYESRYYLVCELIPGAPIGSASDSIRVHLKGNFPRPWLTRTCLELLDKYCEMRDCGVLHGDIHPENVMLSPDGSVYFIDFGLSSASSHEYLLPPRRGGQPFFYDPQLATAIRENLEPPQLDEASEQFILGALLFRVLTGSTYIDFATDESLILEQVCLSLPRPFSQCNTEPSPSVERVLARALEKNPSKRFPDVRALRSALATAFESDLSLPVPIANPKLVSPAAYRQFIQEETNFCDPSEANKQRVLSSAPVCSLMFGAGGIAYGFYKLSQIYDDSKLLTKAYEWILWAEARSGSPDAFTGPKYGIASEDICKTSLYHSKSGLLVVRGLISHALEDRASAKKVVISLNQNLSDIDGKNELVFGHSGLLLGLAWLYEAFQGVWHDLAESCRLLGDRIEQHLQEQIDDPTNVDQAGTFRRLGIAHGWAGILFSVINWRLVVGKAPSESVKRQLTVLANYSSPTVDGVAWPVDAGRSKSPRYPNWCNGSSGFVHLWVSAYESYSDDRFKMLATRAADHAYLGPLGVADLCCGLSGRAYALLSHYRATGERNSLKRAQFLSSGAMDLASETGPCRHGLYKGALGVALLLADLERPELSYMPLFERERWF